MEQQTAVEHFLQILQVNFPNETYDMFGKNKSLFLESLETAKQIEKEQIIVAFYEGMKTNPFDPNMGRGAIYYNETYGQ